MIITQLFGGLGNQMFQYALGRHLALRNKTDLKFDISKLLNHQPIKNAVHRDYALDIFQLNIPFANSEEVSKFHYTLQPISLARHAWQRISKTYIKEKAGVFNPLALQAKDGSYLDGYWQSESYFKDIANTIRKDFSFRTKIDASSYLLLNEILANNSVCLHVRRSDYVSNPATNKFHGTCSPEYYARAAEIIAEKAPNPHFYIFSDDQEWCKANIRIKHHPLLIVGPEHDGDKYENKFKLMTQCKHHITANSSFSWWAAWLNQNPQKVIIAPERWFNDPKLININNIVPSNWIKT